MGAKRPREQWNIIEVRKKSSIFLGDLRKKNNASVHWGEDVFFKSVKYGKRMHTHILSPYLHPIEILIQIHFRSQLKSKNF